MTLQDYDNRYIFFAFNKVWYLRELCDDICHHYNLDQTGWVRSWQSWICEREDNTIFMNPLTIVDPLYIWVTWEPQFVPIAHQYAIYPTDLRWAYGSELPSEKRKSFFFSFSFIHEERVLFLNLQTQY